MKNSTQERKASIRGDANSLLYGIVFVVLGIWLIDLGSGLGLFMLLLGLVGFLGGLATFLWKSPKIKILQAIDSFLLALGCLMFMGTEDTLFSNPLIALGAAAFLVWVGYDNLREYSKLSKGSRPAVETDETKRSS